MARQEYIDLATLQDVIKEQVGHIEAWVKVELDSCKCSGGHWYLGLIQKSADGEELAKARGIIWRWKADLVNYFRQASGKELCAGISILVRVTVNYDARYGMSLIINDLDAEYTTGQREKEKQATLKKLGSEGLMEAQQELALPYLPGRIAVISSADAAGYGDFTRQLEQNQYGFLFDTTLFHSVMQGDSCPQSIADSIELACEEPGAYDLILILRGGGAESDLFCYDDYNLCRAIASCPIPVLTAIGHERDYHIADMVAREYFKTPTALAAFLVDWVADVEAEWTASVRAIKFALGSRISVLENETKRCVSNISFALNSCLTALDHRLEMLENRIKAADPRSILSQGYVLASDSKGNILKSAKAAAKGDDFKLRFKDGLWDCRIEDTRINKRI